MALSEDESSPAETTRLLQPEQIELVVDGESSSSQSYSEVETSLLAAAEALPDDVLPPPTPPRRGLRRCCCCGNGKTALPDEIEAGRRAVLKLAKVSMAGADGGDRRALHEAALAAVYGELTGRAVPDGGFNGDHWEEIGFQGSDPARDLRAAGMLAVLQLRFLCAAHRCFARSMLALSQEEAAYFPLATVSINVTAITLQVLRSKSCHRLLLEECDGYSPADALRCANRLYAGMMAALAAQWQAEHCTIVDFQRVSEALQASCLQAPRRYWEESAQPRAGEGPAATAEEAPTPPPAAADDAAAEEEEQARGP